MTIPLFSDDINAEAKERRQRWGHIARYPAPLVQHLIQKGTLTVEERNELIEWKRAEQWQGQVTQESGEV